MIGSVNGWEWLFLAVIVLIVVGPDRLPEYARQLARIVREVRRIARGASARVQEEMGPELAELRRYDPRQYDPRRIIRDALQEEEPGPFAGSAPSEVRAGSPRAGGAGGASGNMGAAGGIAGGVVGAAGGSRPESGSGDSGGAVGPGHTAGAARPAGPGAGALAYDDEAT